MTTIRLRTVSLQVGPRHKLPAKLKRELEAWFVDDPNLKLSGWLMDALSGFALQITSEHIRLGKDFTFHCSKCVIARAINGEGARLAVTTNLAYLILANGDVVRLSNPTATRLLVRDVDHRVLIEPQAVHFNKMPPGALIGARSHKPTGKPQQKGADRISTGNRTIGGDPFRVSIDERAPAAV